MMDTGLYHSMEIAFSGKNKMPKTYQNTPLFALLFVLSSACFAQAPNIKSEPGVDPAIDYAQQRQLKGWWDEPKAAAALALETSQVTKLTELQDNFKKTSKANSTALKEQETLLGKAILAADDKKVASIKEAMLKLNAAATASQIEFKIAGLAVLNKQQLAALATTYPEVLNKKWGARTRNLVRSRGNGKKMRGANGKKARQLEKASEKQKNHSDQENKNNQ